MKLSMRQRFLSSILFAVTAVSFTAFGKITPEQAKSLPPAATHPIDFAKEIKPIFEKSCVNCHGHGRSKGNFRLDNRETFLKGGDSGAPIVIGKSDESLLIELVIGFDPDSVMPQKGTKLTKEQVGVIRAWIDQGAKWDEGGWFGKVEAKNLKPRLPQVPANKNFSNPIDRLVDADFQKNKIKWPEPVSDRLFARRVWLDILGLLPPAGELEKFVVDKRPDKREKLVATLLADKRNYAEHWLTFWNDMLRNDYKGTGYIDGGRKQITKWLFEALENNKPYDQFVAELVNPSPASEGFSKGFVWRGVVNASQTPQMQAAQNISQVFMGLNLKCASCHDSFVNDWQLTDAYALANIYADEPLEIFQCDKPLGKKASTRFLYPEFGEIDTGAAKTNRLKQLAASVTSPKNGRLSRTLVNRMWGKFFGHALVEPVDDMEKAAWNSDLLDWLAEDFVAHNYDIKHLIKQIVTSRTYQLPAVNLGEQSGKDFIFRGPSVRRMTAEEFRDALTTLTGIGYSSPDASDIDLGDATAKRFALPIIPKWIWSDKSGADKALPGYAYFRKTIELSTVPTDATALVTADNVFALFVNGKKVGTGTEFKEAFRYDLRPFLKKGKNIFAAEVVNNYSDNTPPDLNKTGGENPAGFLFYARLRHSENGIERTNDFVSDKSWAFSSQKKGGWEKSDFADADWKSSVELGEMMMLPWRVAKNYMAGQLAKGYPGSIRASLVASDSLMTALGRPNRDQVVTTRASAATTLQALEMTNGKTLSDILKRGASNLASNAKSNRELIRKIYAEGLGRKPNANEIKTAEELIGKPVKREGVEDFLWAMTMLPEFQLIY
jgi:hypothetical protein